MKPMLGLFLLIAFVVALFVVWKSAKEKLFTENSVFDGFFLSFIGGLLGARLAYIIIHFDEFGFDASRWIFVNAYPGFDLYGGLLAIVGMVWLLFRQSKTIPFWDILDGMMRALVIAYVIGSIGGGFAGIELGYANDTLYKGVLILVALCVLTGIGKKARFRAGFVALLLLAIFFLVNFLVDSALANGVYYGQLNVHQWFSIISLFVVGAIAYYHAGRAITKDIKLIMITFPKKILKPVENYLKGEEKKTKQTLSKLKKEDPFSDPGHASDNAASDTDAFEQSSHQRIESLMRELTQRLKFIGNALLRLKKGKYGICEKCGAMISTERLSIMPTATVCVDCEKKKEQ